MTGGDLISYARDLISDNTEPYLWSNELLLRFAQEAERDFCQRTHALQTTTVTVDTVADQSTVALDGTVLSVKFASIAGVPLKRSNVVNNAFYMRNVRGTPCAYGTGQHNRTVTFYPTPDAVYTVDLVLAVLPDRDLQECDDPVIPLEYHHLLADFMAYKALITNDVDGNNTGTAMIFEERWHTGLRDAKRNDYLYRTPHGVAKQMWTGGK